MKKNPFIKIVTIIILAIAVISLVFGSAIMLMGTPAEETNSSQNEIAISYEENEGESTGDNNIEEESTIQKAAETEIENTEGIE